MRYKTGDKVRVREDLDVGKEWENWLWTDEMFEGRHLAGHREIRIIIDGNKTSAIEGKYKGIARCSPEDEFNIVEGVRLAVERLEESKAWPRVGDDCFEVAFCGNLGKFNAFSGNVASIDLPAVGKIIFRTREEAQAQADKLNAVLGEDQ